MGRKDGAAVAISRRGDGSLSNVAWARSTSVPSGVSSTSRLATIDMGQKLRGGCAFFSGGSWVGPRPTSIPSGMLVHPAVWPQRTSAENWGLCTFRGGEMGPHLTQCHLGRGLPPYQVASSSIQPLGHNRHRPKIGARVVLFFSGELDRHRTQSRPGRGLPPYQEAS